MNSKKIILNVDRETELARRQRIEKLVARIQRSAPSWSKLTPWQAEAILERGAATRQRELFSHSPGGK